MIHSFAGDPDGRVPDASLLPVGSLLFGTTSGGGTASGGTVFSIKPSGAEKVRYNFATTSNYSPQASLVKAGALLYGTTKYASGNGYGSVFSISQTGAYKTLYAFKGGADGAYPLAPLGISKVRSTAQPARAEHIIAVSFFPLLRLVKKQSSIVFAAAQTGQRRKAASLP